MTTKILKSIKGRVVRLTRLDECGVPVVGSCSTVVSECFIKATISGEYEAGDEYFEKSAWGTPCINDKDPDILKRANVKIDFAELNPDALDIITGANPIVSGGVTIGSSQGPGANETAFALEIWTKRTGVECVDGDQQWGYFVVPFVKNGKLDGDLTIENAALTASVMGEGFASSDVWGESPYDENPLIEPFPDGEIWADVVTTVQPPADTAGCIPLAATS